VKRATPNGGNATVADAPPSVTLDRRQLLRALQHVRSGDFAVQLPGDWTGVDGEIAETFNEIVAANKKSRTS
jgi:hypothetical protein